MPIVKLDSSVALDQDKGSGGVVKLPSDVKLDSGPSTTAPGLAASFARGAAPYAAGAAVGAAMGAPFAGVGAVPGAIAGMGAVGATELGGTIYNAVGRHVGLPHMTTPSEATDAGLTKAGIREPHTAAERLAEEAGSLAPMGVSSAQTLGGAIKAGSTAATEKWINDTYKRAIKPSVAGKSSASQLSHYDQQVSNAIHTIVANKSQLKFAGEEGEVAGELPKSIEQFADAIDQAKEIVFKQYDALARAAGDSGVSVDLRPTLNELWKLSSDPVVKDLHPELAQYAEQMTDRLSARGSYSVVDAQRAIQNLNATLKSFYSHPTYEAASRASVDALIANKLRGGLDQAIESATAPGYQGLKDRYGALKTIEKEVVHRSVIEARKNAGGGIMGNIGDLASAEEVIRGFITLNPAAIARGAALKGFASYVKYLRDPNRAIRRMFEAAEKIHQPEILPETPEAAPPLALPPPKVGVPSSGWTPTGAGIIPPESPGATMEYGNPPL